MSRGRPAKSGFSAASKPSTGRRDRHDVVADAEALGAVGGVRERLVRGVAVGQHDAVHALGPERVDRHRGAERRVDAAGEAEHHARESGSCRRSREGRARRPRSRPRRPPRPRRVGASTQRQPSSPFSQTVSATASRKAGIWQASEPSALSDEGGAVEDELVLAADLVEIDERQPALGDARDGDVAGARRSCRANRASRSARAGSRRRSRRGTRRSRRPRCPRRPACRCARRGSPPARAAGPA